MKFSVSSFGVRQWGLLATAVLCLHCGSSKSDAGGGGTGGTAGTTSSAAGAGGSGIAAGGSFGGAVTSIPGAPGCGLGTLAAFCDSFDAPASGVSRAGELDPSKWSAARNQPQFPTSNGLSIGIASATLPKCRAGVPASAFPDGDTLICDPDTGIASNHLVVATAAQNYGQNSYRVRQPFDFAGRTGKIAVDAEGFVMDPLLGWVSIEVTEDPIPGPGFAVGGVTNDEGTVLPNNGFEVQFQDKCAGIATVPSVAVRMIVVYDKYVGSALMPTDKVCLKTKQGNLNHFEVTVSQSKIEVFGTDYSENGSVFGTPQLMYSADVKLPFTRGYVNITTHNHATRKYSMGNTLDAWVARWDNVGFDGPVLPKSREYSIPDALVPGTGMLNMDGLPGNGTQPVMNIGYRVADVAMGPSATLHFAGVDLSGMTTAKLALSAWYLTTPTAPQYVLKYRFNGGTWHDRPLTSQESGIVNGMSQGQLGQMIDVPFADLVAGDNTVEFVTAIAPQNYPPVISNIDLILSQ